MALKSGVIKNPRSGLVLDASEYEITVQRFTGSLSQIWTMEPAGNGKYFIVNKGNGNVLDVRGAPCSGSSLTTAPKHEDIKKQKWMVKSDYSIVNVTDNLSLDIERENYSAGTKTPSSCPIRYGPAQRITNVNSTTERIISKGKPVDHNNNRKQNRKQKFSKIDEATKDGVRLKLYGYYENKIAPMFESLLNKLMAE